MKIKQKKGISLIVLVITIIVMIILAAAIILALNSNNIVGKAHEAKTSSDESNLKEAALVVYAEYDLKTKTGKLNANEISADKYVKDSLKGQGFSVDLLENLSVLNDGTIQILPKIPQGFVMSIYKGEQTVSDGLVIYETNSLDGIEQDVAMKIYNQYVWIPVVNIDEFVRRDGYRNGVLQELVSSNSSTEPFSGITKDGIELSETNDLTGEYAEYANMTKSVAKYGGFYIGRYEAGTTTQRTNVANGTSIKEDGKTPDVLCQKDKYPYDHVAWGPSMTSASGDVIDSKNRNQGKGAVELSRSLYPKDEDKDVVSTLCYGVQWDAAVYFMKNIENPYVSGKKYIEDASCMGWYKDNYLDYNSEHKTGIDVGLNKSNMVKNVYDMAGNIWELTMEGMGTGWRIFRGGIYYADASSETISSRLGNSYKAISEYYGFRVALYLK